MKVPDGKWSHKYDKCIKCGTTSKRHASRGLCSKCNIQRDRKENPIRNKLTNKRYMKTEKYKAYRKKYGTEYYKKNKERLDAYQKEYRNKNKERLDTYQKEYRNIRKNTENGKEARLINK